MDITRTTEDGIPQTLTANRLAKSIHGKMFRSRDLKTWLAANEHKIAVALDGMSGVYAASKAEVNGTKLEFRLRDGWLSVGLEEPDKFTAFVCFPTAQTWSQVLPDKEANLISACAAAYLFVGGVRLILLSCVRRAKVAVRRSVAISFRNRDVPLLGLFPCGGRDVRDVTGVATDGFCEGFANGFVTQIRLEAFQAVPDHGHLVRT